MITLSVSEIEGGTLSVTEEQKKEQDWSWRILVVGCVTVREPQIIFQLSWNDATIGDPTGKFDIYHKEVLISLQSLEDA